MRLVAGRTLPRLSFESGVLRLSYSGFSAKLGMNKQNRCGTDSALNIESVFYPVPISLAAEVF